MSAAGSIQDSQLGLTQAELIILRQEREIVAAQEASRQGQSQSRNERSTMAEPRGRGTGRTSQASSTRGNSAASSSAARRVRLDSTSLSRIQNALENFMRQLTSRIEQVCFAFLLCASSLNRVYSWKKPPQQQCKKTREKQPPPLPKPTLK